MIIYVYESEDNSLTVFPSDHPDELSLLELGDKFLRSIEGPDWDSCMKLHHELMGFEPYVPMNF